MTRDMTDDERAIVDIFLAGLNRTWMPVLTTLGLIVVGGTTLVLTFAMTSTWVGAAALRLVVAGWIVTGMIGLHFWRGLAKTVAYRADLRERKVEVVPWTGVEAGQLLVSDHRTPAYVIADEHGRALLLHGEYLAMDADAGRFPSTKFEVTRALRSRLALSIAISGEPLTPRAVANVRTLVGLADGELLGGGFAGAMDRVSS